MSNLDAPVNINAQWIIDQAAQAALSNQMFVQFDSPSSAESGRPDGAYLTFGHINPPVFNLGPGETAPSEEVLNATVLPVLPTARVYVTFDRLKAFVAELDEKIAMIERPLEGR